MGDGGMGGGGGAKKNNLRAAHFLGINFTFCGGRKQATMKFFFFYLNLDWFHYI